MRVIQIGLGPIGNKLTKFLLERNNIEIVGAVDSDPAKIGKDLGELAGLSQKTGVVVCGSIKEVLREKAADIAVLTTTSSIVRITEQIKEIIENGLNIVSTCEELSYPWLAHPELSREIDQLAKEKGVTVLATGVNPGFVMDFFPTALTGVCQRVDKIVVERLQDAQFRRVPFQKKIGAGLTVEQFRQKVAEGTLRHVGLPESMHMIASRLGWEIEKEEEIIQPIVAQEVFETKDLRVEAGNVLGVEQIGRCQIKGEERITLIFRAAIGLPDSVDRIIIKGDPDVELAIKGGIFGDTATCAITLNAIPVVLASSPGLKTMVDSNPVTFFD